MGAGQRIPMELDELRLAGRVHEAKRVDAEALHHPVAARDRAVGHHPHQHVSAFRHERDEIPERVVRGSGLRHRVVRLGLHRVHQIRELHRILDEEHRDVVADEIPVAFVRIELDGEAAHIARRVGGAAFAGDRREAHEYRRAFAGLRKDGRPRQLGERFVALEESVRTRAAGMHDALWNALMIEVRDLLAEDEILQERGPAQPGLQRILIVGDRHTLVGGQDSSAGIDSHAIERAVAGIDAQRRTALADLHRCIGLGERAGAD